MTSQSAFTEIAALADDLARAGMLHALMDGRALTASELARVAGITPQTASGHLARMAIAGLLAVEKQGRHRYHRLASPAVAQMVEGVMQVASGLGTPPPRLVVGPRDAALRAARTCYDHLAGRLGVALEERLVRAVRSSWQAMAELLPGRDTFFSRIGFDLVLLAARSGRRSVRVLCRPCLDWSERRPHIAGTIGAALCAHSFGRGWICQQWHPRRHDYTKRTTRLSRGVWSATGMNHWSFPNCGRSAGVAFR